jgi:hypothetical protein
LEGGCFFIRIKGKIKANPGNAFVVIPTEDSFLKVIQAVSKQSDLNGLLVVIR